MQPILTVIGAGVVAVLISLGVTWALNNIRIKNDRDNKGDNT